MSKKEKFVYLGPISGATLDDGTEIMLHPKKVVCDEEGKEIPLDPEQSYVARLIRRKLLVPAAVLDKLADERAKRRAALLAQRSARKARNPEAAKKRRADLRAAEKGKTADSGSASTPTDKRGNGSSEK